MSSDEHRIASFSVAFPDLYPRAVRLAQRILGDRAAAEDVAAEAMTRAFSHWERIGSSVAYQTGWVLRVTTNLAIDAVRRGQRSSELADGDVPPVGDVEEKLTNRIAVVEALRTLPRRQQEAVALRYLAGLSQLDVADVLGVRPGTVARHVHRGLAGLRSQLAETIGVSAAGRFSGRQAGVGGSRGSSPWASIDVPRLDGGLMKVSTVREAAALVGTDRLVTAHVTDAATNGGYSVDIGVPAVLMGRGQEGGPPLPYDPTRLVGEDIECVVVEADAEHRRVVVSPPVAPEDREAYERRRQMLEQLRVGDVRSGRVQVPVTFGAFVDIDGLIGLVHVSEMGDDVGDPREILQTGQEIEVEVLDVQVELQRISLRLR